MYLVSWDIVHWKKFSCSVPRDSVPQVTPFHCLRERKIPDFRAAQMPKNGIERFGALEGFVKVPGRRPAFLYAGIFASAGNLSELSILR